MIETMRSTELLIKEGIQVMVYCSDDPFPANEFEQLGASAIMPYPPVHKGDPKLRLAIGAIS